MTKTSSIFGAGWIAPDGSFYRVSFGRHEQKAMEILSAIGHNDIKIGHAVSFLMELTWVHVGVNYIRPAYTEATDSQIATMWELFKNTNDTHINRLVHKWLTE